MNSRSGRLGGDLANIPSSGGSSSVSYSEPGMDPTGGKLCIMEGRDSSASDPGGMGAAGEGAGSLLHSGGAMLGPSCLASGGSETPGGLTDQQRLENAQLALSSAVSLGLQLPASCTAAAVAAGEPGAIFVLCLALVLAGETKAVNRRVKAALKSLQRQWVKGHPRLQQQQHGGGGKAGAAVSAAEVGVGGGGLENAVGQDGDMGDDCFHVSGYSHLLPHLGNPLWAAESKAAIQRAWLLLQPWLEFVCGQGEGGLSSSATAAGAAWWVHGEGSAAAHGRTGRSSSSSSSSSKTGVGEEEQVHLGLCDHCKPHSGGGSIPVHCWLRLLQQLLPSDFQQQLQGVIWQYEQERTFAAASGVLHLLQDLGLDYPALLPSDVENDNGVIGAVLLLQLLQVSRSSCWMRFQLGLTWELFVPLTELKGTWHAQVYCLCN